MHHSDLTRLRELLETKFNLSELQILCTDLGVDYEDLAQHDQKSTLANELIRYLDRRGNIPTLLKVIQSQRPDIDLTGFIGLQLEASFEQHKNRVTPTSGVEIQLKPEARVNALVGLAVDLSASMKQSIRNDSGNQISRLESFRQAFSKLVQQAKDNIRANANTHSDISLNIFVYGFGLREIGCCDLLSLFKVAKDVISNREIEDLKRHYTSEMQSKYRGYEGTGDLLRQLGLGSVVRQAESIIRETAESTIRHKIQVEISRRIGKRIRSVEDTTMSISDVEQLWVDTADTLNNAEELIYGNTPMCQALRLVLARFSKERCLCDNYTDLILFILSDGRSTDGDPLPIVEQIQSSGVTVTSCLVTDDDIADPRKLFHAEQPYWPETACTMFEMASPLSPGDKLASLLRRKGWTFENGAKRFIQVNHSTILEKFVSDVLSPFEPSQDAGPVAMQDD